MKTKIKKAIKALGVLCAVAFLTLSASAQTYYTSIPMPFITLAGGGTNGSVYTSTNLANGWQSVVAFTNVAQGWNTSSNAFIYTTNIVYSTNTQYAQFDAIGKPFVVLESDFGSTTVSNEVLQIARSVSGLRYDDLNNIFVTNNPGLSADKLLPYGGLVQIDMRGYVYGRIVVVSFQDNSASDIYTNLGKYFTGSSVKQGGSAYGN